MISAVRILQSDSGSVTSLQVSRLTAAAAKMPHRISLHLVFGVFKSSVKAVCVGAGPAGFRMCMAPAAPLI